MSRERHISRGLVSKSGAFFSDFLQNHTAAGPATVRKYSQVVEALLKRNKSFSIEEAGRFCKQKNRTYVRAAVSKYIEFLENSGDIPEDSALKLIAKLPKVHEPPARRRTLPESSDLIKIIRSLDGDYRRVAWFIFYTGARISEALDLRLKDVDFTAGECTIYTKHKIERAPRIVKPPGEFIQELKVHLGKLGILGGEQVFLPDSKASLKSRVDMFNQRFKSICLDVLGKSVGSHEFRRFAGTKIYEATGDIKLVRDFLGHADVRTTMRYAEYADKNNALEKGRDIMTKIEDE